MNGPSYCTECGTSLAGPFCSECGTAVSRRPGPAEQEPGQTSTPETAMTPSRPGRGMLRRRRVLLVASAVVGISAVGGTYAAVAASRGPSPSVVDACESFADGDATGFDWSTDNDESAQVAAKLAQADDRAVQSTGVRWARASDALRTAVADSFLGLSAAPGAEERAEYRAVRQAVLDACADAGVFGTAPVARDLEADAPTADAAAEEQEQEEQSPSGDTGACTAGVSACAFDNGIDFNDLRSEIASVLQESAEIVVEDVNCDVGQMPPNRVPIGGVIPCAVTLQDGRTSSVEVAVVSSSPYYRWDVPSDLASPPAPERGRNGISIDDVETEAARQWTQAYGTEVTGVACTGDGSAAIDTLSVDEPFTCRIDGPDGQFTDGFGVVTSQAPFFSLSVLTD